ncbi:MAG: SMC family ATPase [Anaerolineae bacterium]|nr:SMC family ATPase [Anaerolineae bacterium]
MQITYLSLKNFKSYQQASFTFVPGTNAIIGENGAGKSTILEAIGFVLFNYRPGGTSLAGLLREGANWGEVVVRFLSSFDEREYEVERIFNEKATTRYRVYDPELGRQCLAEGGNQVYEWLRQHLCLERTTKLDDLFESTVGVPQGTFTAPFLLSTANRRSFFESLLQVEDYRKASDKLLEVEHALEAHTHELQNKIAKFAGQLEELPRTRAQAKELEQTIAEAQREKSSLFQELERLNQRLSTMEDLGRRISDRTKEKERLLAELQAKEQQLSDARKALQEAQEAQRIVERTLAGYQAYQETSRLLQSLEEQRQRRDALRQEQNALQTQAARLLTKKEQLQSELQKIAAAEARLEELEPLIKRQEELEALLEIAREERARLEELQKRKGLLGNDLQRAREEFSTLKANLQKARQLEKQLEHTRLQAREIGQKLELQRKRVSSCEAMMENLSQQKALLAQVQGARCPTCEAELSPERQRELLARNQTHTQKLEKELAHEREQLRALQAKSLALEQQISELYEQLHRLPSEEDLKTAQERVASYEQQFAQLGQELSSLEDAPLRLQTYQQELAMLENPREEYRFQLEKASQRTAVEEELSKIAEQLAQVHQQIAEYQAQMESFGPLEEHIRQAMDQREQYQADYESFIAHQQAAEQLASRRERVAELKATTQEIQEQLTQLDAQLKELQHGYDPQEHEDLRDKVLTLRERLSALETLLQEREDQLKLARENIARLEQIKQEKGRLQKELERKQAIWEVLHKLRELLRQAGPYITQHLVQQISQEAALIYADIMGNYGGHLRWTEDYALVLETKGHQRPFHQLSGGEQMGAALALRLALLRKLSPIDIVFLDEPTAHLDPERRESLAERITQVRGFSQLFVISHDDTFERVAQRFIRVVKDERGSHPEED